MSRSVLWSTLVFIVFAFATLMIFFWVRSGSLEGAGRSMDNTLSKAGSEISGAANSVVQSTNTAIDKATDGDDRT
jgi:hypothetical protein